VCDHGLIRSILEVNEALAVANGDALAFGTVDEDPVQGGTGDEDARLSIALGISRLDASEKVAVLVLESPLAIGDTDVAHWFDHTGSRQNVHTIGSKAQSAADVAGAVRGFENLHTEAGLLEEEGENRPGDAASNDQSAGGSMCHSNLPQVVIILAVKIVIYLNIVAGQHKRKELEHLLGSVIGRELGARSILFHQALANLAGVAVTDLKCLDYVDRKGDVTAGDLAQLTGLTTGAITAAIDRLEKAGLAKRERSERDRRKVFIRLCPSPAMARLLPFYEALGRESAQMVTRYSTQQLETIKDFCERCIEILRRQTEAVLSSTKAERKGSK
jgi:DNA-binding transcriptional ArsR family regulator